MRISDWSSDVCSSDLIVEPKVFGDDRGFFMESWNARAFEAAGIAGPWVQDNHSRSARGVLRGLHYQVRQTQGKLVRATAGAVRSEEHTSELQSLMRISYAVFCLKTNIS